MRTPGLALSSSRASRSARSISLHPIFGVVTTVCVWCGWDSSRGAVACALLFLVWLKVASATFALVNVRDWSARPISAVFCRGL